MFSEHACLSTLVTSSLSNNTALDQIAAETDALFSLRLLCESAQDYLLVHVGSHQGL